MKAKTYRLETVLGIRSRAKDEAAKIVALRFHQLEQAETELSRRQMNLQNCYNRQNQAQSLMNDDLGRGVRAGGILAHQNYLNDLRKIEIELKAEVEAQIKTVADAERAVETAREKLVETARDLKAIETHKDNWQAAERTAESRREQKIGDEIGSILHGRRDPF